MTPLLSIQVAGFEFAVEVDEPQQYARLCRAADFVNFSMGRSHPPSEDQDTEAATLAVHDAVETLFRYASQAWNRVEGPEVTGASHYADRIFHDLEQEHPALSEVQLLLMTAVTIAYDFLTLWNQPQSLN